MNINNLNELTDWKDDDDPDDEGENWKTKATTEAFKLYFGSYSKRGKHFSKG